MHDESRPCGLSRRQMLARSGMGFGGLARERFELRQGFCGQARLSPQVFHLVGQQNQARGQEDDGCNQKGDEDREEFFHGV